MYYLNNPAMSCTFCKHEELVMFKKCKKIDMIDGRVDRMYMMEHVISH